MTTPVHIDCIDLFLIWKVTGKGMTKCYIPVSSTDDIIAKGVTGRKH